MKSYLTNAVIVLVASLPLQVPAQQTTTTTAKAPIHHATSAGTKATAGTRVANAAKTDAIKLPASIPAANGVIKTGYALRYIDIKVGTGEPAQSGMSFTVHYTGWLYDGTKFDSSVDRGTPFDFIQGQHRVIAGWDTGFDGMRVGGKRRLFIPYQLAYGETAKGPIPAKSGLIFDIELVAVKDLNASKPGSAPLQ